eukprot:4080620-Amphidinium_carterae.1
MVIRRLQVQQGISDGTFLDGYHKALSVFGLTASSRTRYTDEEGQVHHVLDQTNGQVAHWLRGLLRTKISENGGHTRGLRGTDLHYKAYWNAQACTGTTAACTTIAWEGVHHWMNGRRGINKHGFVLCATLVWECQAMPTPDRRRLKPIFSPCRSSMFDE